MMACNPMTAQFSRAKARLIPRDGTTPEAVVIEEVVGIGNRLLGVAKSLDLIVVQHNHSGDVVTSNCWVISSEKTRQFLLVRRRIHI